MAGQICSFLFSDGTPCGLPEQNPGDGKCRFHMLKRIGEGDRGLFARYVEDCIKEHSLVNLSNLTFLGMGFNKELLGLHALARRFVFARSNFNECKFNDITFTGDVDFTECVFTNSSFVSVRFHGQPADYVIFTGAVFHNDGPVFSGCSLDARREANFAGAVFETSVMPFKSSFIGGQHLDLHDAQFDAGRLSLMFAPSGRKLSHYRYLVIAAKEADFSNLKFDGHLECVGEKESTDEAPLIDFSLINFPLMRSAYFIRMNLERARFTYSVTESIRFVDVQWPIQDDRLILYDDLEPVENTDLDDLRWEYNQLKKNYEYHNDFVRTGEWYYRETEVRRRMAELPPKTRHKAEPSKDTASQTIFRRFFTDIRAQYTRTRAPVHKWFTLKVYRWYKLISEYGENYPRVLVPLAMVWALSAIPYFFGGFSMAGTTINYDIGGTLSWQAVWDFLQALLFSLGAMCFQVNRTSLSLADNPWVHVVYLLQLLCTAILVPLFLLALRRKFRR